MRKIIAIIGCEIYAVLLALQQWYIGVRTDEAKYLLDIPYPHPPLGRAILSLLDGWVYGELFWRVVLATLTVQAVWLMINLLKDRTFAVRLAAAFCWLFSAAVVLQAGSVMMVILTALQGMVAIWLFLRERPIQPYLLALGWLASLFTAYQAVLYAPLVLALLLKNRRGVLFALLLTGIPIVLLAFYSTINPLALASMLNQAGKDAGETLLQHATGTLSLWFLSGSIVLSIIGTIGLFIYPKAGLLGSFLLVLMYVFLARYDYYAILFTPLFMAGLVLLFQQRRLLSSVPIVLMPIGLALMLFYTSSGTTSIVPQVYGALDGLRSDTGTVLINGSFGHEWQHGTSRIVQRYHPLFIDEAVAVICVQPCAEMQHQGDWDRLEDVPVEVWVHHRGESR